MSMRLYLWQRGTAALMVPLVIVHIAVILYVSHQGMTAADILSRTHGSVAWASYYGLFVAAASIHASIGVRNILTEWSPLSAPLAGWIAVVFVRLCLLPISGKPRFCMRRCFEMPNGVSF